MATSTTFSWIYLGSSTTVLDPTEGNTVAENAGSFLGTFGSSGSPLYTQAKSATMNDLGGTANALDANNTVFNDTFTTDIGAGTQTFTFDSSVQYNTTITYIDGTTATVTAVVVQSTTGELFLAPEIGPNADTTAYEAKPILSVSFLSVAQTGANLASVRQVTGFDDGIIQGTAGADLINNTYVEPIASGSDRIDSADGTTSAPTGWNDDVILAGGGNDTVVAGLGNDQIDGGAGADSLNGGARDDTFVLSGTFGNDTLIGGETTETAGDLINATAITANGTLTFTGGEAGTLSDGTSTATFSQIERFQLGSGNDTVNGAAATLAMNVDGGAGADSMTGGTAADTLTGGIGADTLTGGAAADSLTGGDGDDTFVLSGTFGNDTIVGGETGESLGDVINATAITTNETLTFTGGEAGTLSNGTSTATFSQIERFQLGSGNDTVNGAGATLALDVDAGAGADSVTGGLAADKLTGGIGNDTLNGGAGADSLDGGAGADSLTGGDGDDTFVLSGTFGNDTIVGGETGETLGDVIDATAITANETLTFTAGEAGTLSDGTSTATFSQIERFQLGSGNDTVNGAAATLAMNVDGGAGADSILGGSAADTLTGGIGADSLDGGDGNDSLDGGADDDTLNGGNGADTLTGGSGNDRFIGLGIGDVVNGNDDVGNTDQDVLDLFGSGWDKTNTNIIFSSPDHESGTVEFLNGLGQVIGTMSFSNIERLIPCFTPGALVDTARGKVPVESLSVGDLVQTRDAGLRPIAWIGQRDLGVAERIAKPDLQPILIRRGALGPDLPSRDMRVSPQHRMLVVGHEAELISGQNEVLVPAKYLVGRPGITQPQLPEPVRYLHFMFDRHEVVRTDAVWSESYQPGESTLAGLGTEQYDELVTLFPELRTKAGLTRFASARYSLKSYEARALVRLGTHG